MDSFEINDKIVCKLKCGDNTGTAFLLTSEIAITATHCLESYQDENVIELEFLRLSGTPIIRRAKPFNDLQDHNLLIILLKLSEPITQIKAEKFIKFTVSDLEMYMELNTYGYPNSNPDGLGSKLTIANFVKANNVNDYNVTLNATTRLTDYSGLSGSPVYKDNFLVGVMLCQNTQNGEATTLGAICGEPVCQYLKENGIECLRNTETEHIKSDFTNTKLIEALKIQNSQLIAKYTTPL